VRVALTRPWRAALLIVAGGLVGVYVAVIATLFVVQRSLLYHPVSAGAAPDANGPPIQVVRIDTADGERLVGWWLPAQPGKPTILFFNGNAAGLEIQKGRWRRIAAEGVGFLAIGYRGYDGSTGHPSERGLREDARAAYDWLARRVPASDIIIHGFSLGSGVAVRLATERPARALILEAPYTSTADVAAQAAPWAPVRLLMLDQFRSRDLIGKARMPLLVIHGDADSVVPFAQGRALYGMARPPKTFVRMIGSDHNTLTRDGAYDHVWRFLGLPAKTSPGAARVRIEHM
jgi:fermentation-respiration switch protein FrsA (DUF1100 family)